MSGISLCTFVRNEAHCINNMINSVYDFVDEVVVVDTGSTDETLPGLSDYKKVRIYRTGFTDFGSMRTLTAHLARHPWVLMLDADETISHPELLFNLTQDPLHCAWALPRKRWLDLAMTQQTELEAYPDWQVRFFRNNPKYIWKRELHEYFHGAAVSKLEGGPAINHFQDVFKSPQANEERDRLYTKLAAIAGVNKKGGLPL